MSRSIYSFLIYQIFKTLTQNLFYSFKLKSTYAVIGQLRCCLEWVWLLSVARWHYVHYVHKFCLNLPKVKKSRSDCNPWLAKMHASQSVIWCMLIAGNTEQHARITNALLLKKKMWTLTNKSLTKIIPMLPGKHVFTLLVWLDFLTRFWDVVWCTTLTEECLELLPRCQH